MPSDLPDVSRIDFIDFPLGFAIQAAIPKERHHPKCSQPAMLCDCGAIIIAWKRERERLGLSVTDKYDDMISAEAVVLAQEVRDAGE